MENEMISTANCA